MKAKYLVSMLALPALLAACVNDDFETQKSPSIIDNDLLKGRETGEVVLKATKAVVGDDAQTRIVGGMTERGGIEWKWEGRNDKIGVVLVNPNPDDYNEIVSYGKNKGYALTNYPFAPDIDAPAAGANFSTPTAVVKGAYVFYNRYDGDTEEGVSRRVIGHGIKEYIDVQDGYEAGLQQVGTAKGIGQNFFISPIVDLAVKDGEKMELPVKMKSLYHILNFKLTAEIEDKYYDQDGNFKIYKVEVEPANSKEQFNRSFVLDPAKLANVQQEVAKASVGLPFMKNGAIEATGENNDAVSLAMDAVFNKLSDPTVEIGEFTDKSDKLIYQMANPATFKKSNKGEELNLMIVLPAAVYAKNETAELRDGKEYGCLKVTMYTSEGVYKCYAGSGDTFKAQRGTMSNVTRTLRIGGGKTNVDLFDFTGAGFDVATTEDWNYAIEYINNQYRDFGEGSTWQLPKLNLSNYEDEDIVVDKEHYFPNYPVIYRGDANLKLVEQDEYSIDPVNVVFGNGTDESGKTTSDAKYARPTIKIEDAEATVKFDADVKKDDKLGKDGYNYTAAIKLVSDATIEIAEDQEVNFEKLISNTALNIAKGATVNVDSEEGDTKTAGTVTLACGDANKAGAEFNIKGDYTNDGTVTIGKLASLNQDSNGTYNNGEITVDGVLDLVYLENGAEAELTVEAWDVKMDDKNSGLAEINSVYNKGSIWLKARKQDASGTYGGLLLVNTKLNNEGDVEVQGHLNVTGELTNTGIVTLSEGEWKYAWIEIAKGGSSKDGKIVLANPADYEFYDSYFDGSQKLSTVTGVIEATLDADTYKKVLKNHGETSLKNQERAWNVINKVIVKGELPLEAEMGELNNKAANKNFVLPEGASINAQEALTMASLTVGGTATLNAKNADTKIDVEELVNVKGNLTIEKNVKMVIAPSGNTMLNVATGAKLTNNGWIDTENANEKSVDINAVIKGELINQGKLAQDVQYVYSGAGYDFIVDLLVALNQKGQYVGTYGEQATEDKMVPRVEKWNDGDTDWQGEVFTQFSEQDLSLLLANGVYTKIGEYWAVKGTSKVRGFMPVLYLGLVQGAEPSADFNTARVKADLVADAFDCEQSNGADRKTTSTWFVVSDSNGGTLDLLYSINPANASHSWAYGKVINSPSIIRKGRFNNELEN